MREHRSLEDPRSRFGLRRVAPSLVVLIALFVASLARTASATSDGDCPHWNSDGAPEPDPFYLPTADDDPFYDQPDPMPCVPPGTILNSREITFSPFRASQCRVSVDRNLMCQAGYSDRRTETP